MKHQLSCQDDRARMAWGRFPSRVPRQFVMFGSTNNERYLKDPTGNRRFCPVRVGKIDLEALKRDRDQLWAEAFTRAQRGESAGIPEELWAAAAEAQQARMVVSPFEERATELVGDASGYIAKEDLWVALGRPDSKSATAQPGARRSLRPADSARAGTRPAGDCQLPSRLSAAGS